MFSSRFLSGCLAQAFLGWFVLGFWADRAMHWDYAAILIFLGAVVPLAGRRRVQKILRSPETTSAERLRLYASTIAFQWIITAAILWRAQVHGMSPAALGLAAPRPLFIAMISFLLVALLLANQLVSLRQVGLRPQELHSTLARVALRIFPQSSPEKLIFFAVVITVAVCEEVMFRGFVQALFTGLSASALIGILGSAAMFSLAHLYQGKRGLIATFIVGLLFSTARFTSASLIPSVCAHFVTDFIAGFMFPGRLRQAIAAQKAASPGPASEHT